MDNVRDNLKPLPWRKKHYLEERANRRLQRLPLAARALRDELLDEQWNSGFIPDPSDLHNFPLIAEIANCTEEEVRTYAPLIAPFFQEITPGRFVDPEIERERTEKDSFRAKQAQFGKQGGRGNKKGAGEAQKASLSEHKGSALETLSGSEGCTEASLSEHQGSETPLEEELLEIEPREEERIVPSGTCRTDVRPEAFANLWNSLSGSLPKVREFTESRKRKVKTRVMQGLTVERFEEVIRRCLASPFLMGKNERGWQVTFDFLVDNDTNMAKILEGKYEKGTPAPPAPVVPLSYEETAARDHDEAVRVYAIWESMSAEYKRLNPWKGKVPAARTDAHRYVECIA